MCFDCWHEVRALIDDGVWRVTSAPNPSLGKGCTLLLDHDADVNSAMPETVSDSAGYTLLLYRTKIELDDNLAYADALTLLERGADPNRAGADGMTFGKMLTGPAMKRQQRICAAFFIAAHSIYFLGNVRVKQRKALLM